jgi:hypothetical protein
MKPFIAKYHVYGHWGYYKEIMVIVVQDSHSAALGEVLMAYPDSSANQWEIDEIDLNDSSITEVSSYEN